MAEYIEREAANEVCRECVRKYPNSFYNGIEAVRSELRKLPAADVRPVVRSEWIGKMTAGGMMAVCPNCGKEVRFADVSNFCPNCGADMREPPKEE